MTQYNHRITIACPKQHTDAANQLALALGDSPADVNTFGTPGWQDAQGNQYSVCSFVCTEGWLTAATGTLPQRNGADLDMAQQAQDFLAPNPEAVSPDTITYVIGDDPMDSLTSLGLTRIETEEV